MKISRRFVALTFILFMTAVAGFSAPERRTDPVGRFVGGGDAIQWQISLAGYDRVVLTILAPGGETYTRVFPAGKSPSLRLQDIGTGAPADGSYSYQLMVVPKIPANIEKQLAAARQAGDEKEAARVQREAGLGNSPIQSGTFSVANGVLVASDATEISAMDVEPAPDPTLGVTTHNRPITPVTNADECIVGSLCVGLDCVCPETFGFDTIKLKENNLRIKFEDTSTTAGFPSNDWQITANDSASGGANKFSIEDVTGAKVPVTIEAGTPTNALFVDSTGRIGFRTSTPVLDLHIATSNTPAIRLEQNNSGGFTAQTWDVGGNEANFFVRDVTGGSRLPLRIRPGAPTSSIDISADGDVGIGTTSPSQHVHAFESINENLIVLVENPNTGTTANAAFQSKSDTATASFQSHASTRTITRFGKVLGGWNEFLASTGNGVIVGTLGANNLVLGTNSTNRLEIGATGGVTVTGDFTATGTKSFAAVDPLDSSKAIYYAALEGPEAGTYFRGTAKTVNGEAVIELPGYFSRITEREQMTVQLTARGGWAEMYIAESSPERLVIKVANASSDIAFDYFVQGVRKGYLGFQVERENNLPK